MAQSKRRPRQLLPFGRTDMLTAQQLRRAQILDQATRRSRSDATHDEVMQKARFIAGEHGTDR